MSLNSQIPRSLPVIHLNNVVMFPYLMLPLVIADENMIKVVDYALANDKVMGFFLQKGWVKKVFTSYFARKGEYL